VSSSIKLRADDGKLRSTQLNEKSIELNNLLMIAACLHNVLQNIGIAVVGCLSGTGCNGVDSTYHLRLNSESVEKEPDGCINSTNAVSARFISAAISCLSESVSGRCPGLSRHVAAEFPQNALAVKAST
jgi:hypothetical protein